MPVLMSAPICLLKRRLLNGDKSVNPAHAEFTWRNILARLLRGRAPGAAQSFVDDKGIAYAPLTAIELQGSAEDDADHDATLKKR